MLRFLIILFYLLFFSDVAYAKDYLGLMNDLEKAKEANISVDLDSKSKQYGYKNFKSFVKDFKKKNNIKRLSTEDARIYFAGYDPTLQIIESKENLDKLHELILNNNTLKRHTSYFKKKNSDKVKWLAVAVDYKKEMAKITKDSNLKKISPFPWGWSSVYAGAAIINCEREKDYLGIKIGPECILVDISKNKEHLNVILPIEKIEMCKENSQRLFPDLYKISDKEFRDKRYKSYCQSILFSLPGIPDNERTPNLIKKQIKKNEFLYSKLEESNPLLIKVKKDEKEKKINDINITNETKAVKIENIVSDSNSNLIKESDISKYIHMLYLITPDSKVHFADPDSPKYIISLKNTDIIQNNRLLMDLRFNKKKKQFELFNYKNKNKLVRIDNKTVIKLRKAIYSGPRNFKDTYPSLIEEYNSSTKKFTNKNAYLKARLEIEELYSNELKNLKFVKKVDNKNQSVVKISANDTEPSKSFDLKVNAVICTFDKKGQTEYSNMLGLMVSIDKCPESGHYKQIKYKMAPTTGYRHHLKKNLCYNPDKNKIKMKNTKCKDNEFYLKYKSENNKDIFYYNSANKKLNPELIAKKKEKKIDKKIVNFESKAEIAKVTEPKQNEYKPKTKDIDNEPPVIEIAEKITVNTPDYEIEGKVVDNSDKIFVEIDGITSEVFGKKFKIKRYSPVDQQIKIVAIDKYGNRSKEKIINIKVDVKNNKVLALEPLNPLKVKSEINSSSVALIIGIEKYENTPAAKYASLDAKYFTEYSKNIFGVSTKNIKLLTDEQANLSNTNSAIFKWLPSKIKKNQTDLIIFYSGHGLASSDGKSKYILPSNVDPDLLSRTALSRNEFFDQIISLKPKSVTIFLDTCYSGVSRDEEMLLASAKPLMIVAEEENKLPENFTIFTASKPDQISSGLKEAKHGIFSYYLMKGLEGNADINKDLKITNGELLAYMDLNVSEKALDLGRQQNPLLFGNESKVILTLN